MISPEEIREAMNTLTRVGNEGVVDTMSDEQGMEHVERLMRRQGLDDAATDVISSWATAQAPEMARAVAAIGKACCIEHIVAYALFFGLGEGMRVMYEVLRARGVAVPEFAAEVDTSGLPSIENVLPDEPS